MPGSVVAIHVAAGTEVETGDRIVTLDAMKMEHVVTAPASGRVTGLTVAVASQVVRGQPLAVIEPDGPTDHD
jgi:biotin carboxyl carrier protein